MTTVAKVALTTFPAPKTRLVQKVPNLLGIGGSFCLDLKGKTPCKAEIT
jgi:hypothetical protein